MTRSISNLWAAFGLVAAAIIGVSPAPAQTGVWVAQGPAPSEQGQVEQITNREVVGAVHAPAPHPTNANTLFIGTVNGGVWRTDNALADSPNWVPQTDAQGALSIGAIEFDPTDTGNQTLVAGIGRFSSLGGLGGSGSGILRTTDGGATWTPLGVGPLAGTNISGVAARGNIIVVSDTNGGIWRSTDTGVGWTQISGLLSSGLPAGASFDLEGVPGAPATLITNSGSNGIYMSTDTGATWTQISNAAMNGLNYTNVRISALNANVIFVAIAVPVVPAIPPPNNVVGGIFRTGNGGANWAAMTLPPNLHPGNQAAVHLSLAADPNAAGGNIVYIGGDRQPFPNNIGAANFSGRLFRGNSNIAAGQQFVHLTHSNTQGPAGGGTINGSSPHADSRNMEVAANGDLFDSDDGGVYRRTVPQTNAGLWRSMNGNLQNTEFHSVAWDAVSNQAIGGAQDVGTPGQQQVGNRVWQDLTQADGGMVAVDDISAAPAFSYRFTSIQNMGNFTRLQFDANNNLVGATTPTLTVTGGGTPLAPQFYTPIVVNNVNGQRMIIGANSVYESTDAANNLAEIGVGIVANSPSGGAAQSKAIAYGAADNANILYVGSGNQVFIRTGAPPAALAASAAYPGFGNVVDVAVDPTNSLSAFAVDANNVFQTPDAGATWINITGDLFTAFQPGRIRSVDVYSEAEARAVIVGSDRGVYWADLALPTRWSVICDGLPNAPVTKLEYDEADGVLLAGTLGRGAWTCAPGKPRPTVHNVKFVCGKAQGEVLAAGIYTTAINIINRDAEGAAPSAYRRSFSVGLPGEKVGGQSPLLGGATLAPGEAVEIDCEDIVDETRVFCPDGLCKGFALIDSPAPLEIVAVYSVEDPKTGAVTDLTTDPLSEEARACTETTLTVTPRNRLFVPRHVRGDREYDGHGPCVRFALDLTKVDDETALAATYWMHAYECSSFAAPQSDFTAAESRRTEIIASAGPGGRILGHSASGVVLHQYMDNNHADDVFPIGAPAPVSELRYVGDTSGGEAGTKTGVFVTFRAIDVRMQTCSVPSDPG